MLLIVNNGWGDLTCKLVLVDGCLLLLVYRLDFCVQCKECADLQ